MQKKIMPGIVYEKKLTPCIVYDKSAEENEAESNDGKNYEPIPKVSQHKENDERKEKYDESLAGKRRNISADGKRILPERVKNGIEYCRDDGTVIEPAERRLMSLINGEIVEDMTPYERDLYNSVKSKDGIMTWDDDNLWDEEMDPEQIVAILVKSGIFAKRGDIVFGYKQGLYESLAKEKVFRRFVYQCAYGAFQLVGDIKQLGNICKSISYHSLPQITFDREWICCEDALLNYQTDEITEFTREICAIYRLHIRAKQKFKKPKKYLAYLRDYYRGNENLVRRELEIIGWLLSPDLDAKKFLLVLGPGDSGKSKKLEFFRTFFDASNTSGMDLHNLGKRFSADFIADKAFNVSGDLLDEELEKSDVSMIKQITGQDLMFAEGKGSAGYNLQPITKLACASNFPLKLKERDKQMSNRVLLLPMVYSVEKKIDGFFDQFKDEKSDIAKLGLYYYRQVKENGYKFTAEEEAAELILSVYGTDSVLYSSGNKNSKSEIMEKFADIAITRASDDDYIISADLYEAFHRFCTEQKIDETISAQTLSRYINKRFGAKTDKRPIENSGNGKKIFKNAIVGVKFTEEWTAKRGYNSK